MEKAEVLSVTSGPRSFADVLEQTKLRESYSSFVLGLGVIIFLAIILGIFLSSRRLTFFEKVFAPVKHTATITKKTQTKSTNAQMTYTVEQGDDLKKISEKVYKTPELYTEIVKANNLANPDVLNEGMKLVILPVDKKKIINTQNSTAATPIAGDSYTVGPGDLLWDIAVRAYGDGSQWTKIANENGITPDTLVPGLVIKLPR